MKTNLFLKALFSTLITFLLVSASTNAQWEYKHASPTANHLKKLAFANYNIGWMVGQSGTILKTIDGGNTWVNQYMFNHDDLIDICVIDSNQIYALTNTNQLYLSSDGGNFWKLQSLFWGASASSISFTSLNEGWVAIGSEIQHTVDGGITWTSQYSISSTNMSYIKMESNGNGVGATTFGNLLHTSDYGQTWNVDNSHTGNFNAMDVNTFYATALAVINNTIYKSTDNGATWNAPINTPSGISGSTPTSIKIIYANIYLLTTVDGELYFTSDGGNTWNTNNSLLGNVFNDCVGLSPTKIIVAGDNGKIAYSNNAGTTLTSLETRVTNEELWGINHNGNTFFAVGDAGTIIKSINNGQNWTNSPTGSSDNLKSIAVINNNIAVSVGTNGTIIRTTNGGSTWTLVNTGYSDDISSIYRLHNGTLYAVGNNDLILKSLNDGLTWTFETTSYTGFQYNFTGISFTSNDTGFIATNSAELITTDDGGQNWYLRMTGLFAPMTCVNFSDGLNGWVGSSNGEIFFTDNGGQSWSDRSMVGFTGFIRQLKFIDANNGWAFTDLGIFKTIDGGFNWTQEFSPCNTIHAADFTSNYSAIAVGDGQGKVLERNSDIQLSVISATYCSGHQYSFGAFTLGNFNNGNTFIAQLSDDFGSFDYPTTVAINQATTMNSINVTIPAGIPPSTLYRLRIASTNPPMYSNIPLNLLDVHDSPQGLIYANGNTTFNNGDSVILINISGASGTYQWYLNGSLIPGAINDSLTVKIPGTYQLNINDGICDGNSNSIEVIVNGFSGISTNNFVNLEYYPNPVSDVINVKFGEYQFEQYQLFDITGKQVMIANGEFKNQISIPVKLLSNGFYVLKLNGKQQSTIKFIKE